MSQNGSRDSGKTRGGEIRTPGLFHNQRLSYETALDMASSLGRILVLPGFFKFPHPEALPQVDDALKMKHKYVQNSINIAMFEAGHMNIPG